ncbi:MerR family transcriptional regulator [Sinorhizobium meliloti]|uniref:MerR family transcriptional regulator n=1 Tax=Rhizobium meliloti TaxID=382 RepID=UPI00299DFDF9|nr:MerR family transcriptional regulator [Sinorhizobium meliloti]MDW9694993.1 MerR family transcriptional regulator [Sinorhizobium meliloti]MDW9719808.1 MerR family transcriptional regulator [Sinorhizobium meliloti]MDW9757062.1 MerR family transcriptional regulator [Sinorhizobium meliloti]
MADPWRERAYSVGEAATLAGIRRSTLDVWCIRQPHELFSEKRGHRRWFSPRDIAVLRMARELERGGMVLLTAIACAYEHMQEPPAADAVFVIPAGKLSPRSGWFISDRDVPRLAVDKSIILIPIGQLVAGIIAACAELRQRAA